MREMGLLDYWKNSYMAKANAQLNKCAALFSNKQSASSNNDPLTLASFSGAYILLLVGFVAAAVALCLEIIKSRMATRKSVEPFESRKSVIKPFFKKLKDCNYCYKKFDKK